MINSIIHLTAFVACLRVFLHAGPFLMDLKGDQEETNSLLCVHIVLSFERELTSFSGSVQLWLDPIPLSVYANFFLYNPMALNG